MIENIINWQQFVFVYSIPLDNHFKGVADGHGYESQCISRDDIVTFEPGRFLQVLLTKYESVTFLSMLYPLTLGDVMNPLTRTRCFLYKLLARLFFFLPRPASNEPLKCLFQCFE